MELRQCEDCLFLCPSVHMNGSDLPSSPFQGEKADSFYIIESGEVSILIKSKVSLCVMMWVVPGEIQMPGVCTECNCSL